MAPVVTVIAPGMMGSAIGKRLSMAGATVLTSLAGRSADSQRRAAEAGMKDVSPDGLVDADIILSVVPPGEALGLAERLSPALQASSRKPVYVDCNAVSPETVLRIERTVRETGARFVDGGIIGPPPETDSSKTRLYVSGPDADQVTILQQFGLSMPVQPGPVGAASAMKMSYAGITKGFTALGAAMMLAATRAGTADALVQEMVISQPALLGWLTSQMPKMPGKAYRWVAEMEEIGNFIDDDQLGSAFYTAAARFYKAVATDFQSERAHTDELEAFCAKPNFDKKSV